MNSAVPGNSYAVSENDIDEENEDGTEYLEYVPKFQTRLDTIKLCQLSIKKWNFLMFFFNVTALLLISGAIATPRWVEQGDTEDFWRGGLLKCSGCNGRFKGKYYSDIRSIACNSLEGYCETFTNLYMGGVCLMLSAFVFFGLTLVWTVLIVLENYGKEFNKKYFGVFAVGSPVSLFVGVAVWHIVTGANYGTECYEDATSISTARALCAIDGPMILVVASSTSVVSSILYYVVKFKMGHSNEAKIQPYKL